MSDSPDELTRVITAAGGGGGIAALVMTLFGWSAKRNVATLDTKLTELSSDVKNLLSELRRYDNALVGLTKDVGYLQAEVSKLADRIDGLNSWWKSEFSEHKQVVQELVEKAKRQ